MHISEGILTAPVLLAGAALAASGLAVAIRRLKPEDIPKTAMLCAMFFVASLVRIPLGPGSVHLVLCGLMGAVLGWGAFIGIFAALLLQALLFQYGGLTTLGVNTFNMAAPAVLLYLLVGRFLRAPNSRVALAAAFFIGFSSILIAALLTGTSLWLSGEQFLGIAKALVLAHLPPAAIEGLITLAAVQFLRKVKPDILPGQSQ